MDGQALLGLWWTVPAGLAVLGYGCSLAGMTRAQRAVWVTARVVEVHQPAHGDSKEPGIPVTVAFQDPGTGREFRLRHAGKRGEVVHAAWLGREFAVRYPRGRPDRFRLMVDLWGERRGLNGPNCLVLVLLVGLTVQAFFLWGWPQGLICFGGLLFVNAAISRDVHLARTRAALLADCVAVPGRVVAVTKDVYPGGEGGDVANHAPVIAFTTREGVAVTALCREGIPDPGRSRGRELTIHYAPADLSVHTPDLEHDRRERAAGVRFVVYLVLGGLAAVATGMIALRQVWPFT
ncbi:DUF3592 domain-containing protein [Streptomyces sp. NPDC006733]|uniref:DUF3592 domain-containing protein n=1 Tax=Streptomyces sp. NPDC006733 TaxID=3155460 RepID=UPI00340F88B7